MNQLNNLGLVYARLGLHEKASQALNAAMTSDFTGRDSMSLAYSMRNLGQQKFLAGLHTQASGLLEESAYLSRKAGDRINEVRARFSFLLNQERLGVEELGERFWRLSEEAGSLRLVDIQWRALLVLITLNRVSMMSKLFGFGGGIFYINVSYWYSNRATWSGREVLQ